MRAGGAGRGASNVAYSSETRPRPSEGRKAPMVEVKAGGREKGKGEWGEKRGVKGTFLMTTHRFSEGHESQNTALQSQSSIHFLMYQQWFSSCYAIMSPSTHI